MKALVLDVSSYNEWSPAKAIELDFTDVIIKSSMQLGRDPRVQQHVSEARAAGMRIGLYHWVDPIPSSMAKQVDIFSRCIEEFQPTYIAGDVEQWWSNWTQYFEAINRRIPWDVVARMPPERIVSRTLSWFDQVSGSFPSRRLLMYSGDWFIRAYAPGLSAVYSKYPIFAAQYVAPKGRYTVAQFKDYVKVLSTRSPRLWPGAFTHALWQFSSSIILDGLSKGRGIDMSISKLDWADFESWTEGGDLPDSNPDPDPVIRQGTVIAKWSLNVRELPTTSSPIIDGLRYGEIIEFIDVPGVWLKLANTAGWVHGDYILKK